MVKAVEVTVRIADLEQFRAFVSAAGGVIRAYDAIRDGGAGTALDVSIEGMRAAMRNLVPDDT